jgi:hypothetical protein
MAVLVTGQPGEGTDELSTGSLWRMKTRFLAALALSLALTFNARAVTNSWTDGSGKWETTNDWSAGAPSSANAANLITNISTKTVTIDSTTTTNAGGSTMTISNLTVSAPVNSTNTLSLNNAGMVTPLDLLNSLTIASGGALLMTNSVLRVDGVSGGSFAIDGTVVLNSGTIIMTNVQMAVGSSGVGQMTVNSGTVQARNVIVGEHFGSVGTLTMPGGTMLVSSNLLVGSLSNVFASVNIFGGLLFVTNATHTAVTELRYGSLTIFTASVFSTDSLIITNPSGSFINNGGTFNITGQAQVDQGTQTFASGITQVSSNFVIGSTANSTGTVIVTGTLVVKDGTLDIGNNGTVASGGGVGRMIISNGTLLVSRIVLGNSAGAQCDLLLEDGGVISDGGCPSGNCQIVINSLGFGDIGGTVDACNTPMSLGVTGPSDCTVSGNANESYQSLYVGDTDVGTLTMAGGVLNICQQFIVGNQGPPFEVTPSVGAVWINGGQLTITNPSIDSIIGNSGVGQMTISNGTVTAATVVVGNNTSNPGTLTVAGGVTTILSNLTVGDCGFGNVGVVTVAGGNLFVTNAAHNATLVVGNGTLTLNSGLLQADKIVMTNACAHFARTGGVLNYGSAVLDPTRDDDGDGIPNGYEQAHGLDPLNAADANLDNDGDGFSNLQEYLAGTDPNNPQSSPLHITAIGRENNNIRVTWSTFAGTTNALQVTDGGSGGNYSAGGFANIFTVNPVVGSTTNYLDVGAATSFPARYYRIRLVP